MQRLFSTFPSGRPGAALCLLRCALSVLLLDGVLGPIGGLGSGWALVAPWSIAASLCLGFITPVAAALCVVVVLATWLSGLGTLQTVHICAVLDATAMMLLGPGAYSLDAMLFGRKRIVFPPRDDQHGT